MIEVQPKQFRLMDDGRIFFQPDPTNPLPGKPVAFVRKGAAMLVPEVALLPELNLPEGQNADEVAAAIGKWLLWHIAAVLEPLKVLEDEEGIAGPARDIALRLHAGLGILPRAELEDLIAGLDPEGRTALRARKVRMGPLLVFLPALNKPAAVRLRGLLWWLWHDRALPAPLPKDGIVSFVPGENAAEPAFYQAIGYPFYGPRAIRVDMLDRLVGAVYDGAEKGLFKAKHEMAEWLGCPIPDLYAVLTAMGHTKVHDPADEPKPEEPKAEEQKPEEVKAEEPKSEEPQAETVTAEEVKAEDVAPEEAKEETKTEEPKTEEAKPEEIKPVKARPELATFRLRRGNKTADRPSEPRPPRRDREKGKEKVIRPILLDPEKDRPRKFNKKKRDRDRDDRDDRPERIIESGPKPRPEDSPFAILKQFKVGGNDGS